MIFRFIHLLIPALICSSLHALVEQKINEKKPLSIAFSKTSHNRVSVEQGSVEKIIGDETFFGIAIDRSTGNAFINVLREIPEPLTLTVVTSTGLIQDLTVSSSDITSEHLILREEEEKEDIIEMSSNFHGPTIEFLNQILEGKIPLGYGQRDIKSMDKLDLPQPLIASPIKALEGPFEEVVVFSIKNMGKDPILISSESLKKEKMDWVFLNAHELRTKEQALCILSVPKKDD